LAVVVVMSLGIRVTATDLEHPEDSSSRDIMDDYLLVTAGSCEMTYVNVFYRADGTETHVITVRGIQR